jgi:hypothetical protein
MLLSVLALALVWGGMAPLAEARNRSTTGYSVTTDLTYRTIYIYPAGDSDPRPHIATMYPPATTLTVSVKDASGAPVAGVPVGFAVPQNSMLQGSLEFQPRYQTTDANGTVEVMVSPTDSATTGVGQILVQVGNTTDTVGITIDRSMRRG